LGIYREWKKIEFPRSIIYGYGNNEAEKWTKKQMARWSEGGWKTSRWKRAEGKDI
jgi:hypothetical protein